MTNKQKWETVIAKGLAGCDLETQEDGVVFRGPIKGWNVQGELLFIECDWVAVMREGRWKKWEVTTPFFININETTPNDIGNGRTHFIMLMLGAGTIFPKDGSKLDPSKVEGL